MDTIASRSKISPMDTMTDSEKRTLKDQFMLRLPDGMRGRIKAQADFNGRSMNAEIVALLHEKFPEPRDPDAESVADFFMTLPDHVQREFLQKYLRDNVSDRDIEDGLIPGVRLRDK